ncbi:MAG: glycosyltransferase family 39 protein [Flexilinea sp.]|nr:glycosyltransferase family 39 protein [Flexilinea sp.]
MLRNLIELGAGCLIIFLPRVSFLKRSPENEPFSDSREKGQYYRISVSILFVIFAFLLFYKVGEIPTPWHVDEAGMAYDALSIAEYGVDRYLYKNPVYFINFGGGQNAFYTYLAALCIKLFRYSILSIRLPALILALTAFALFVHMIRREYGETAALIGGGLLCILPFSIMHTRWALESYLLFPMMIISTSIFTETVKSGKTSLFFLSGLLFGITLYTYAIAYIFLALFLLISVLYLLILRKVSRKQLLTFGFPLFLLAFPLLLMLAVNNGYMNEIRTNLFSIPKLLKYRSDSIGWQQILPNLQFSRENLFYKIFFNDGLMYNAVTKYGTLYCFSIPFILSGFVLSCKKALLMIRKNVFSLDFLMTAAFFSTLLTSLLISEPNINRVNMIYFPLIYFLCLGVFHAGKGGKIPALLTAVIYLALFTGFFRYYFNDFQKTADDSFYISSITDLKEALDFAEEVRQNDRRVVVVGKSQPYIYTILALKTDPYTFDREKTTENLEVTAFLHYSFLGFLTWDEIPADYVYIFRDKNTIPENIMNMGFATRDFGSLRVYYSPK